MTLGHASRLAVLSCCLLVLTPAQAVPFRLDFTTTLASVEGELATLAALGAAVHLAVIVDNGGDSLLNQTWTYAHTVQAELTIGTYSALFLDAFFPAGNGFRTDATGHLIDSSWFGTADSAASVDSFGQSSDPALNARLHANGIREFGGAISLFNQRVRELARWSDPVAVSAIPEPLALTLFATALLATAIRSRRRVLSLA